MDRYLGAHRRQVELLEGELTSWYAELSEAFALRDWGEVARIYRAVAGLADRLEEIDPGAYSRVLAAAEQERERIERERQQDDASSIDVELQDLDLDMEFDLASDPDPAPDQPR